jgi:DNA mismatch repair protein MutS2
LAVGEVEENVANRFHRGPVRRWWDRTLLRLRGFDVDPREVVNRLIVAVYLEVAPALRALLQVIGPLQVYLGTLAFAAAARERGLKVCRPEIVPAEAGLSLERLFNPLLLRDDEPPPVPCDVAPRHAAATVVVTGPNSGGKTRMLQAVGIAQVLGQAGLLVPARSARVPVLEGLFVSLVEHATADQAEGRLGSELARIRRLFEEVRPGSMVLLDELCSGTNPSEAVEIVSLVLDLLGGLRPVAFITTHFLDYAQQLRESPPYPEVEFLRVVSTEDHVPTYQFTPGVAETSLAVNTARRMGVTFDGLADLLVQRFGIERPVRHGAPGGRET